MKIVQAAEQALGIGWQNAGSGRAEAGRRQMGSPNTPRKTTQKRDVYGACVPWCTRSDISPLRYPGGKRKLAPFIADLIARAGLEVELLGEPFAGGAAVAISLLESGHVQSIALADADPLIAAFWKTVFSRSAHRLADMVCDTRVSLAEWRRQK